MRRNKAVKRTHFLLLIQEIALHLLFHYTLVFYAEFLRNSVFGNAYAERRSRGVSTEHSKDYIYSLASVGL